MSVDYSAIAQNLSVINDRMANAARRSGRRREDVTLVAVSKTFPAEAIRAAHEAGVRQFGENRVQEFESKHGELTDLDATWHLIGHLQSNKAKKAANLFQAVDSVDDLEVARKLNKALEENPEPGGRKRLALLIEVRLSTEETKSGASEEDLVPIALGILALPQLELRGLMTIPPYFEDAEKARPYFRKLRELRESLRDQLAQKSRTLKSTGASESLLSELSMGMSHDFETAIEEGATQIRVGTALFGARPVKK